MSNAQPLNTRTPIVDKDGNPTEYFIRWAKQFSEKTVGNEEAASWEVQGGVGIDGGGPVSEGVTLDLSDTAVTPDTYGDSAHVPQITVDQQGRITDVEEIAISGGGGGAGWVSYTVATAGDAFINIPLTGKAYEVIVRGQFVSANDYIALRWSNNGGTTWVSGASDYKDTSSNATSRVQLIGVTSGAGREFVSQFKLTGLNQARKASLTGTASASNSSGSLTAGTIAGYDAINTQNINAIRIYSNGGTTMDDVLVMIREIAAT